MLRIVRGVCRARTTSPTSCAPTRAARALAAFALATLALVTAGATAAEPASGIPATGAAGVDTSAAAQPAPAYPLQVGHPAWVDVSVATLWRSPSSPRPVDRPALTYPVQVRRWLADMSLTQRRGLWHRADTDAVLGERARVVALRPGWAKVVVPDQPTPLDRRGYPGWVPRRQITARPPADSTQRVTVVHRTAWLRSDDASADRRLEVSFGTRLPYLGVADGWVRVAMPRGGVRRVAESAVSVHRPGDPALPATRADIVRSATMFKGLPYLWGGLTGFGFDCSGLTWMDYRVHGITIPRDARPQSMSGTPVRVGQRRPGDLLFYATDGVVHHVSMYVGHGMMVHAPHTGSSVQVIPVATPAYQREYAGARRYLR